MVTDTTTAEHQPFLSLWHGERVDVVLAQLYSKLQPSDAEPFSVSVLAGALVRGAPEVTVAMAVIDEHFQGRSLSRFITMLDSTPPKVLGLSVPQGTLQLATDVLKYCGTAQQMQSTRLLLGHEIPSRHPDLFQVLNPVSSVVRGWGDDVIVTAVRTLLRTDVSPPFVWDARGPASASVPIRIGQSGEFSRRIEGSRGCAYGVCSFCARSWMTPRPVRFVSDLDRVEEQVAALEGQGVTKVTFTDEDFCGGSNDEFARIVSMMSRHRLEYQVAIRLETLLPTKEESWEGRLEFLRRARSSGLVDVFVGIESFVPSQERRYRKYRGGPSSRFTALNLLEQAGIGAEIGLIIFDPLVTPDEIRQSASVLLDRQVYRFLGHPFGMIHLREGSAMSESRAVLPLRGAFLPNTLEWEYVFADPTAACIHKACMSWWEPLEYACSLGRNFLRSWPYSNIGRQTVQLEIEAIRHNCAIVLRDACLERPEGPQVVNGSAMHRSVFGHLRTIRKLASTSGLFSTELLSEFDEAIRVADSLSSSP